MAELASDSESDSESADGKCGGPGQPEPEPASERPPRPTVTVAIVTRDDSEPGRMGGSGMPVLSPVGGSGAGQPRSLIRRLITE